jgi:hypothetical protein
MKYILSGAEALTHRPKHPERTARRAHSGLDFDVTFQVWPNRKAMAKSIRMQQAREPHPSDWRAVVPLTDGEGY